MSEGGQLQWKCQSLDTHRGPTGDYSSIQKPLPDPPKGYTWVCNPDKKEWSVVQARDDLPTATLKSIHVNPDNTTDASGYIAHPVRSTDTIQGLCLKYKVSQTALRQLNHFSGSNLALAPHTLIVPKDPVSSSSSNSPNLTADTSLKPSTEKNIQRFLKTFKSYSMDLHRSGRTDITELGRKEAVAYLDMNNGNVEEAIQDAKDDIGWEDGDDDDMGRFNSVNELQVPLNVGSQY